MYMVTMHCVGRCVYAYIDTCMCVYVYAYVYAYGRILCMYVCIYVCMYVCTYVCTYVYTYIHTYIYTYTTQAHSCPGSHSTMLNTNIPPLLLLHHHLLLLLLLPSPPPPPSPSSRPTGTHVGAQHEAPAITPHPTPAMHSAQPVRWSAYSGREGGWGVGVWGETSDTNRLNIRYFVFRKI